MTAKTITAAQTIESTSAAAAEAIEGLRVAATAEGAVTKDNVRDFAASVDDLIDALRAIKSEHKSVLRVVQSQESVRRTKERTARALALLAEVEAKEAAEA